MFKGALRYYCTRKPMPDRVNASSGSQRRYFRIGASAIRSAPTGMFRT